MNETSRQSILTLPLTSKEVKSTNRNKTAYHTFVSIYIIEFNQLSFNQQKELLLNENIHQEFSYLQYDHDPIIYDQPKASATDKMRLASKHWGRLSHELKESWLERSTTINNLPIWGEFDEIPPEASNEVILHSINLEYTKFVSLMHGALKREPRFIDSVLFKTFGKERIQRRSLFFRSIHLNHILKVIFFGPNYSYVRQDEIVHRTKRCVVMHLHSHKRIQELFEKNEVNPFLVDTCGENEDRSFSCAGKVVVKKRGTRLEANGYVEKEEKNRFSVILENEDAVEVEKPQFNKESGRWLYLSRVSDCYDIIEYDPVRIKILEKGNIHFLFHRIKLKI